MIIIWRGAGILAALIPAACTITVVGAVAGLAGEHYIHEHNWPIGAGLIVSAAVVSLIARVRNNEEPGRDSLYFIPLQFWSVIFGVIGLALLFVPGSSQAVRARSDSNATPGARTPAAGGGQSGRIYFNGKPWPPDPQPQSPSQSPSPGNFSTPYNASANPAGTLVRTQWFADLRLDSIAYNPKGGSTAVLRGNTVREGDQIASYSVVSIQKNSVTLQTATGRRRVLAVGETEDPLPH